jgi:hypothetical protein
MIDVPAPSTQSIESVVEMLNTLGRESDPLPSVVMLAGMALVLSSKKDCYYATLPSVCSCPASVFHPGKRCKHSKKYFSAEEVERTRLQAREYQSKMHAVRTVGKAGRLPAVDSIMPSKAGFRPILE